METIGPEASKLGIYHHNLLQQFTEIQKHQVTNRLVKEIYKFLTTGGKKEVSVKAFHEALSKKYDVSVEDHKESSFRSSIRNIIRKFKDLQKNTKTEQQKRRPDDFLDEVYQVILSSKSLKRKREDQLSCQKRTKVSNPNNCTPLDQSVQKLETHIEIAQLQSKVQELEHSNHKLIKENKRLTVKLKKSNDKLKTVYGAIRRGQQPKRFFQNVKNRNKSIELWKKKAKLERQAKRKVEKSMEKIGKQPGINKKVHSYTVEALKSTIQRLKEAEGENRFLQNQVEELKEEVIEQKERKKVETKTDGKRINPSIKEASMYLQSLGVAEHRCSQAIKFSVETVTDVTFDGNLPSRTTQGRLPSEMKALALKRVAEKTANKKDLTAKYDGSTDKRGRHVTEVEVATASETFLVGLRTQVSGTAEEYAETIQDALHEVDQMGGQEKGNLLSRVSNTMTDRHVVNSVVDRHLETAKGSSLHKLRCFMHPLDSFHKVCEKVLKEKENVPKDKYTQNPYTHRGESMTQAFIRCVSKLFHDVSVAVGQDLINYLRSTGFQTRKENPFQRWVGSKFNILFESAKTAYVYSPSILQFLSKVSQSRNPVSVSILNFLKGAECNRELKCLGVIEVYFTGPWERLAKNEDLTILDVNEYLNNAVQQLQQWIETPKPLLTSHGQNCFGQDIDLTERFIKTIHQEEHDDETAALLSSLLQAIMDVIKRQLSSQLPGGEFWNPSQQMREETKSCSATNISGERKFGKMKAFQTKAPSMTIEKIESKEMFEVNKVREAMMSKTKEQRREDVLWATKAGRKMRQKDRQRAEKYQEGMLKRLRDSRKAKNEKEEKGRTSLENMIATVFKYGGLWETPQDMQDNLDNLSETAKREAIKSQVKLRTHLLKCKAPNSILLTKSNSTELKNHLETVMSIEVAPEFTSVYNALRNPRILLNATVVQKYDDEETGQETDYRGTITKMIDNEFEFTFDVDVDKPEYLTIEEVIVDLASGDLTIVEP